jgi:hypothetical protein
MALRLRDATSCPFLLPWKQYVPFFTKPQQSRYLVSGTTFLMGSEKLAQQGDRFIPSVSQSGLGFCLRICR